MDAQDIVDDALRTRDALAKLESAINSEIDAIGFQAFQEKRDLTADERSRRDHLRASRGEVQDAFAELAFVTLAKLNRSSDVQNLLHDIAEANGYFEEARLYGCGWTGHVQPGSLGPTAGLRPGGEPKSLTPPSSPPPVPTPRARNAPAGRRRVPNRTPK